VTDPTIRLLAEFKRLTGMVYQMREFESIQKVSVEGNTANLLLTTYSLETAASRTIKKRRGLRLITWQRNTAHGNWYETGRLTMWDEDFAAETILKFGAVKTATEIIDKREFEKQCYRPGTSKQPLDNYERTLESYTTADMERYW